MLDKALTKGQTDPVGLGLSWDSAFVRVPGAGAHLEKQGVVPLASDQNSEPKIWSELIVYLGARNKPAWALSLLFNTSGVVIIKMIILTFWVVVNMEKIKLENSKVDLEAARKCSERLFFACAGCCAEQLQEAHSPGGYCRCTHWCIISHVSRQAHTDADVHTHWSSLTWSSISVST